MNTADRQETYLTPPEVAEMWGVNIGKVMGFIDSGELVAVNMANNAKGERPRYRIRLSDIHAFEAGRTTTQAVVKRQRRTRHNRTEGVKFFSE